MHMSKVIAAKLARGSLLKKKQQSREPMISHDSCFMTNQKPRNLRSWTCSDLAYNFEVFGQLFQFELGHGDARSKCTKSLQIRLYWASITIAFRSFSRAFTAIASENRFLYAFGCSFWSLSTFQTDLSQHLSNQELIDSKMRLLMKMVRRADIFFALAYTCRDTCRNKIFCYAYCVVCPHVPVCVSE